ncbi:hypothetical protein RchiOBHm_Chr6g0294831 [Rosa chinensis]|uniref:Uncharacterized protein n=1 Tax=Rosa chinensis TaxID=74649 RepID=A0A2P6PWZ6_ROSCH|nr:hypothetical protein RchiOBHm_Chr6g0294831 [Rosa chinensis]
MSFLHLLIELVFYDRRNKMGLVWNLVIQIWVFVSFLALIVIVDLLSSSSDLMMEK